MSSWKKIALVVAVASLPGALAAQETPEIPPEIMEALQKDVATLHQEVMQASVVLEPGETGPFWSIYDEYLGEIQSLTAERTTLLRDFAEAFETISDDQAMEMGHRALDLDEQHHQVLSEYFDRIGDEVGGGVAGQFLQIESRIRMLKQLRLAMEVPIIGS